MIACYDLALCPPTYDAVAFLALAEQERLRRGDDHIDVVILPGPAGGFRDDGFGVWPHTVEGRVHVRDNILVPLCRLLASVRSVEVAKDRSAEGWGKGENYIGLPRIVEALRAGSRPLRAHDFHLNPIITFTLREAAHWPLRNSRVSEWQDAVGVLGMRMRWNVVVVRDDLVQHIGLLDRARLYASAALNVGICNGPMWMSIFMDAPTLMLRPTTNAAGGCYDDAFYAQHGVPRGSQLPNSPPHQRLVWEEDTCESIVRAVEEMLEEVA